MNYQWGSRNIISQLTGPVNTGRLKNVVMIYAGHVPDLEVVTALITESALLAQKSLTQIHP